MRVSHARTDSGFIEMSVDVRHDPANRKAQAAELRNDAEYRLVGDIVADEDRIAVGEWRAVHQVADRIGLVDAGRFDLDDELAGQNFNCAGRGIGANLVDRRAHRIGFFGRQPIVQSERIAFVLGEDAGAEFGHARRACA